MRKMNRVILLVTSSLLASPALAKSQWPRAEAAAGRTIRISVGSDGFAPAEIRVKSGEKVKLVFTRTTDQTCAKAVEIKDLGVSRGLPLGTPVSVPLNPYAKGKIRFACPMDRVAGNIVVE